MTMKAMMKDMTYKIRCLMVMIVTWFSWGQTMAVDVKGHVYGGGNAADVKGNAEVTIETGKVQGSVYGGGNIGSVGTFTVATAQNVTDDAELKKYTYDWYKFVVGEPFTCADNTGICMVSIYGDAIIGPDAAMSMKAEGGPTDVGHVFGAGRGTVDFFYDTDMTNEEKLNAIAKMEQTEINSHLAELARIAYVNKTIVTISGSAFIKGSVYGGSENGHVLGYNAELATDVKIQGGQIGCGMSTTERYDEDIFSPTYVATDATNLECSHWDYVAPYTPYDIFADENGQYHWPEGTLDTNKMHDDADGARNKGTDGHTFYGNVFGGGSGYYSFFPGMWNTSAGVVRGNTSVEVSGGHVLTSIYGGNEMTDVHGTASVKMTGGTLGVPRTVKQINEHPLTCYLFGAGKGDQRIFFNKNTNVDKAKVEITGGIIYGSVFGGGEDGHVMKDVELTISEANPQNPTKIGTTGTSYVDGNVFGGGRGFSGEALTAGNVGGCVTVNIQGGKILGSIYGGGRLASVGYGLYLVEEEGYGVLREDNTDDKGVTISDFPRGHIVINISGGTIGNDLEYKYEPDADYVATTIPNTTFDSNKHLLYTIGGNVFTGCMGRLYNLDGKTLLPLWTKLGRCKTTELNITGGTVKSSVYGGSEMGTVGGKTEVNITGGTVGTKLVDENDATKYYYFGSVFGGGKGSRDDITYPENTPEDDKKDIVWAGTTEGNVTLKLNENVSDKEKGGVVHKIFGCNDLNGSPKGTVEVRVYATQNAASTQIGNTEAVPASGDNPAVAAVTDAKVQGRYDVEAVYGGGNMAAYIPTDLTTGKATVIIDGCKRTSVETVYGGGNAASTPATDVTVNGTFEINEVFGGGNGKDRITIKNVEMANPGANVGFYDYSAEEDIYDTKEKRTQGESGTTFENKYVYGTGVAAVNIFGGLINHVFGGSNTKGNVRQTAITLLEEKMEEEADDTPCCPFRVGDVYGGGKSAPMDADAKMYMACIPGLRAAYGGAEEADIQGGVTLNITNGRFDRVFGGNNISGTIHGPIEVNIEETGCRPIIIGELYGGGNQAAYSVYGYYNDGSIKESGTQIYKDPVVNVKSFTSIGKVFGGGYGSTATVVGNPTVNINVAMGDKAPHSDATIGEKAKTYNDEQGYPVPSHASGKIGAINNVYGGGNEARVIGNTTVNIGTTEKVYMLVNQELEVDVTDVSSYYTRTGAGTSENPYVYTKCADNSKAAENTIYYERHEVIGADIRGNVYGGGNKAEVTGNTNVTIGKEKPAP